MSATSRRMTAAELCSRTVVVTEPHASLAEAARMMREQHVGCVVVVRETAEGRQVVGLLTDRDIVTTVVARDVSPSALRVEDVMTGDVVCANEGDSLHDVLATMQRRRVRRVPVVGPQQRLVGLIAADDVLRALTDELLALAHVLAEQVKVERLLRP
ncbi:MAG TPA: CBS domain-containing protein [Burkholderiaceae bacterium]|nr:CBS domain-containing protein [Burkholderiaceae bacterium]